MSADNSHAGSKGPGLHALSESKRRLIEQRLRRKRDAPHAAAEGIPRRVGTGPRLASAGERWIFLAHESHPASSSFNVTSTFRVGAGLDLALLERAVNRVVARHEILRSTYRLNQSAVEVIVHDHAFIQVQTTRCDDPRDLMKSAEALVRTPFDLARGPLLRLHCVEAPGEERLLTLVVHDIVFDGWSRGLFWKETAAFYREASRGEPSAIAELRVQYGDFAEWQRAWLATGRLDAQLQYWKARLAKLEDPILLPTDRPYPAQITDTGRLERWRVSADVAGRLKRIAAGESASPFMILLAAFQILLHRYTGATDVVVGSPVANRPRRETADLIGFFLNTIALRTRLDGALTAREVLRQVRQTVLDAVDHQDVPFDRVVEAVKPPRVQGRHPVVQVMFVYQSESEAAPAFAIGDVELGHTHVETETAKFDLTLFAAESGDGMETILEYRTDLFDRETTHRMLRHYSQILDSVALDPDQRISQLRFITEEERELLFEGWQGERLALAAHPGIVERVAARVESTPHAAAVQCAGRTVTYRQLSDESDSIARELLRLGAGRGGPVAHFMDRAPESIAAILGILKAGAGYVPIDPEYPEARHRFIIRDSGIDTVVTTSALLPRIAGLVRNTVLADVSRSTSDDAVPLPDRDASQTAYVIYTSGSTGDPKGVVVSDRNLLHSTEARVRSYANAPRRFLLIPSFSFDSSVAGIFWTLVEGGTLVIAEVDDLRDPSKLVSLIRDQRVSDLLCIPALYRELLGHEPRHLQSLARVIVAGESCPPQLVARHYDRLPQVALFNEYGPTEVSVWATVHACTRNDAVATTVPIGRPIPNASAYVLDAHQQPMPVGMAGELFLGGEGLSQGYHEREELTRQRFVTCALPGIGRIPLYRTGDRARWRRDGVLEFLGREDDQIKMRGYRIELGEIESALEQHQDIERAVVVAASDARGGGVVDHDDLAMLVNQAAQPDLEALLMEIERLSSGEVRRALEAPTEEMAPRAERAVTRDGFRLELHTTTRAFVNPPREAQRHWLLGRAMEEFADDLEQLDRASRSFVRGYDHKLDKDIRDIRQAALTDQEIMEDWQTPLMKAMAKHVTESHGDVLEIGFGRGVSAEFIQQLGVASHTVVEPNDHSVRHYFDPWRRRLAERDIRLFHARWQDVDAHLGLFDGIFFHAFPMNEQEFADYVLKGITFAEHAFGAMAAHLRDGGVFTYLTTEIDSLGRGHQRSLLRHFRSISMHVEPLQVPEDTHDTWWSNSMVVVKAVK